jgi:hypothetical protein
VGESSRGRHHAQHEKSTPPAREASPPDERRALQCLWWEKGCPESTRTDQDQRCNTIQFLQLQEAFPSQAHDLQQQVPTASDAIVIVPQMDESTPAFSIPSPQNSSEVIVIIPQELSWDLLLPKKSHKQTRTLTAGSSVSAPSTIVTDQQGQSISPLANGTKDSTTFGIDQQLACTPPPPTSRL